MERRLEPDGARLVVGKDAQAEPLVVTGDQAEVVSQLANRSIGESADGRVCVFRGQGKMKVKKKKHVPAILLHLALNLIVTHRRVLEHRILSAQRNERAVKHHQPCPRHTSATRPDYRTKTRKKKKKRGKHTFHRLESKHCPLLQTADRTTAALTKRHAPSWSSQQLQLGQWQRRERRLAVRLAPAAQDASVRIGRAQEEGNGQVGVAGGTGEVSVDGGGLSAKGLSIGGIYIGKGWECYSSTSCL